MNRPNVHADIAPVAAAISPAGGTVRPVAIDGVWIDRLKRAFFLLIILAAILNGSTFWLKRVGWLEPSLRATYFSTFHHGPEYVLTPEEVEAHHAFRRDLYRPVGLETVPKISKDLVTLAFLFVSLWIVARSGKDAWRRLGSAVAVLTCVMLGLSFLLAWRKFGWFVPLAGLRSCSFLFIFLLGQWAAGKEDLQFFSRCLLGLILFQLLLVPVEFWRGIPLFPTNLFGTGAGDRAVGTFLLPISLGVTAVIAFMFYRCHTENRLWEPIFLAGIAILVLSAGSATALVLFFIVGFLLLASRVPACRRGWLRIGGAMGFLALVLVLPYVTGRLDLYDSLWGRLLPFQENIAAADWKEVAFGRGLGVGTNSAFNYIAEQNSESTYANALLLTDSTPSTLFTQFGVTGLVGFYSLLLYAALRDARSRLLYLLFALAGLTVNVGELFPMNVLLGLLLAGNMSE